VEGGELGLYGFTVALAFEQVAAKKDFGGALGGLGGFRASGWTWRDCGSLPRALTRIL